MAQLLTGARRRLRLYTIVPSFLAQKCLLIACYAWMPQKTAEHFGHGPKQRSHGEYKYCVSACLYSSDMLSLCLPTGSHISHNRALSHCLPSLGTLKPCPKSTSWDSALTAPMGRGLGAGSSLRLPAGAGPLHNHMQPVKSAACTLLPSQQHVHAGVMQGASAPDTRTASDSLKCHDANFNPVHRAPGRLSGKMRTH